MGVQGRAAPKIKRSKLPNATFKGRCGSPGSSLNPSLYLSLHLLTEVSHSAPTAPFHTNSDFFIPLNHSAVCSGESDSKVSALPRDVCDCLPRPEATKVSHSAASLVTLARGS